MIYLIDFLDKTKNNLIEGNPFVAITDLISYFHNLHSTSNENDWVSKIIPACRSHSLNELLMEDPYTWRAFHKPRGYAGDAVMLDFIYGGKPPENTTPLGQKIFQATTGLSNSQSVIFRKNLLASKIDETAYHFRKPKILSIACGHLREAQQSKSVAAGEIGEFYALDQDEQSLDAIAQEQKSFGIQPILGSVGSLIRKQLKFDNINFAYAAGLFDYLSDALSKKLLLLIFQMLSPNGSLLVANFTQNNHGRGFMECFMDWNLICRNLDQMESLQLLLNSKEIKKTKTWIDPFENVVYLEITKN